MQITLVCLAAVLGLSHGAPYSGYGGGGDSGSGGLSLGGYGGGGGGGGSQDYGLGGGGGGGGGNGQQVLEVSPEQLPVQVHFRTASSRVNVQQSHNPSMAPKTEFASFQDEPHRVSVDYQLKKEEFDNFKAII